MVCTKGGMQVGSLEKDFGTVLQVLSLALAKASIVLDFSFFLARK